MATLAEMRQEVRDRADLPSTNFPTDTEIDRALNQSLKVLYGMILDAGNHEFYVASAVIPTIAGTSNYALPNGTLYSSAPAFLRMLGVEVDMGGPLPVTITPFNFQDRNAYLPGLVWSSGLIAQYRVLGSNIRFIPTPTGVRNVTLTYAPQLTTLTALSTFDGFNGWEEWAVLDVAGKMCDKSRLDPTSFLTRQQLIAEEIRMSASRREQGFPPTVTDVEGLGGIPYWQGR